MAKSPAVCDGVSPALAGAEYSPALAGAEVGVLQIGVERLLSDPKTTAELHRFQLAGMDQPIDRHLREAKDRGNLGDGEEFASLEVAGQRRDTARLC